MSLFTPPQSLICFSRKMGCRRKWQMNKKTLIVGIIGVLLLIQPISAQIWRATTRLTFNPAHSENSAIAADSNNHLHVVWSDITPGNREIYYKRSTDGGVTWGSTKRLTWNKANSSYPAFAPTSSDHIHMVWHSNTEIYYRYSTKGGSTWLGLKRLTWNAGWSTWPDITTASASDVHVIWHDDSPGNVEIYYKNRK